MTQGVKVPGRIQKLETERRGLPIPFFAYRSADGTPDFTTVRAGAHLEQIKSNLCWICGQELRKFKWFIGGELFYAHGVSNDGPMHEECARYSLEVCPYLAISQTQRTASGGVVDTAVAEAKPSKIVLLKVRKVRVSPSGDAYHYHLGKYLKVEWFNYERS